MAPKTKFFSGYRGGEEMPLVGYAGLLGLYGAGLASFFAWSAKQRRKGLGRYKGLSRRTRLGDLILMGIATHKLTRTISRDWVTAPVRAPFTEYQGSSIHGEVKETSRGGPIRRAVGDLLTCNYCTGPWVAAALWAGMTTKPEMTRFVSSVFAATAISDFLHRGYEASAVWSETYAKQARAVDKMVSRIEEQPQIVSEST